jgi:hypothetical protein
MAAHMEKNKTLENNRMLALAHPADGITTLHKNRRKTRPRILSDSRGPQSFSAT